MESKTIGYQEKLVIGSVPGSNGKIFFSMEGGNFSISSVFRSITVPDHSIKMVNGKSSVNIEFLGLGEGFQEIEIPENVLKSRDKIRLENELMQKAVSCVETGKGKIFFSIEDDERLLVTLEGKTIIADRFYQIEGKTAVHAPELDLDHPFLEVPREAENALINAKKSKALNTIFLEYAGTSLLSGLDYYRLNAIVPKQSFDKVKICFENVECGEDKGLKGWLTSKPGQVESILRIKNTIASRKSEIEKQKKQSAKAQAVIIKKLTS